MSNNDDEDPGAEARREQNSAWSAVSLMLSGLVFWGGIGWLLTWWLDSQVYVAAGILIGVGAALYLIWIRYGRA